MLPVFDEQGEKCAGEWEFTGLREDENSVTAMIRNTKGTPIQEYAYNEKSLSYQIERIKLASPTIEAAYQLSILSAGLFAVRQYKLVHRIRLMCA